MKISNEERQAIRTVVRLGEIHGYGNLISHLAAAWAIYLIDSGMPEKTALLAVNGRNALCLGVHRDIIELGEWDETGEKYRNGKGDA